VEEHQAPLKEGRPAFTWSRAEVVRSIRRRTNATAFGGSLREVSPGFKPCRCRVPDAALGRRAGSPQRQAGPWTIGRL